MFPAFPLWVFTLAKRAAKSSLQGRAVPCLLTARAVSVPSWMVLFVGFLCTPLVVANPVPADDLSLTNGAESYELHCAQCHGWGPVTEGEDLYEPDVEDDDDYDFSDLIDQLELPDDAQNTADSLDSESSEWDQLTAADDDVQMRAAVLDDLNNAIDEAYGASGEPDSLAPDDTDFFSETFEDEGYEDHTRMPGATNLADPESYFYGTSEESLFNSIANGTSTSMPGWRDKLSGEEAVWDLVNFVRSLWSEEWVD